MVRYQGSRNLLGCRDKKEQLKLTEIETIENKQFEKDVRQAHETKIIPDKNYAPTHTKEQIDEWAHARRQDFITKVHGRIHTPEQIDQWAQESRRSLNTRYHLERDAMEQIHQAETYPLTQEDIDQHDFQDEHSGAAFELQEQINIVKETGFIPEPWDIVNSTDEIDLWSTQRRLELQERHLEQKNVLPEIIHKPLNYTHLSCRNCTRKTAIF
jgi:hypothetical protein